MVDRYASATAVLSSELVRLAPAVGQSLINKALRQGLARAVDEDFLNTIVDFPGCPEVGGGGSGAGQIIDDIADLLSLMTLGADAKVWAILDPTAMQRLALSSTTVAAADLGISSGTMAGINFLASDVQLDGQITVVSADRLFIDRGLVTIDVSRHADLHLDSDPSDTAYQVTSLWQSNLVAVRASRYYSFARSSDTCVGVIVGSA